MEENRTLLIVDGEKEDLKSYKEYLSPEPNAQVSKGSRGLDGTGMDETVSNRAGYRLLFAESGEEALQVFQNEVKAGRRVAAGFLDLKLAGEMDGLATIQAIKSMDPGIHFTIVTGYLGLTVEEIDEALGEKFSDQWDYLSKPCSRGEIVQKARQMVAAWNRKKQMETITQQWIRADRAASVAQVARGVGHEFGNILQRIIGKVDLAFMEKDINRIFEHLKVVIKAAERAGVLVKNLQAFSRSEPSFQFDSIVSSIEEAVTLLNHEFVKHSIQLEKEYKEIPSMRLDVGALAQVFLNLMVNAVDAMPDGGKLRIICEQVEDSGKKGVQVRIADTGTGIAQDVVPRIFDFAFSTKGDRGSGLGLAVSKDIIESHNGKINVKTELQKGTEFSIWLPLLQ